jgi:hypothetical protein
MSAGKPESAKQLYIRDLTIHTSIPSLHLALSHEAEAQRWRPKGHDKIVRHKLPLPPSTERQGGSISSKFSSNGGLSHCSHDDNLQNNTPDLIPGIFPA